MLLYYQCVKEILERLLLFSCVFLNTEPAHLFCEALWLAGGYGLTSAKCTISLLRTQKCFLFGLLSLLWSLLVHL